MENQEVQDAVEQGLLIQRIDGDRTSGDRFQLPSEDRTLFDARLNDLVAKDLAVRLSEGDRSGASTARQGALEALKVLLHDGYNHIKGFKSYEITPAQRSAAFAAYGWRNGELGDFDEGRTLSLSRSAGTDGASLPATHRYPAQLVTLIGAQLAIVDGADLAHGGDRKKMTDARQTAFDIFENSLARARYYYCSASDDTDQSPELSRIGFQARRDRGEVHHASSTTPATPPANPSGA